MAYCNRASAKGAKGDLNGALADCNEAIKLEPNLDTAYDPRGNVDDDKRNLDAALADYTTAIKLNPDYAAAYFNRGVAKHHKGDSIGALADYNKAITLWQIALRQKPNQKQQLQKWIEKAEKARKHATQ